MRAELFVRQARDGESTRIGSLGLNNMQQESRERRFREEILAGCDRLATHWPRSVRGTAQDWKSWLAALLCVEQAQDEVLLLEMRQHGIGRN